MEILAPNKITFTGDWYLLLTPYLFALYTCLSIYTRIRWELPISQIYLSVGIAFLLTSFSLFFFLRLTKNVPKATLLASLSVILLLSYGQIYRAVQRPGPTGELLGAHRVLAPGLLVLFLAVAVGILKLKIQVAQFTSKYLLLVSVMALSFPLINLVPFEITRESGLWRNWEAAEYMAFDQPPASAQPASLPPDIYYLILDGYGRADVLQREFAYDNTDFLEFLEGRGFYVAGESRSNYLQTVLSLASSLNMSHLIPLAPLADDTANRQPIKDLIQHSQLHRILADQGYRFVAFDSGFPFTEIPDADVYLEPFARINEFEEIFLGFSSAILFDEWTSNPLPYYSYDTHRSRIEYTLEELKQLPQAPGPKMVFAHLILPHPPFVFDAEGKPLEPPYPYDIHDADMFPGTPDEYLKGYALQVEFTNRQIQSVVDQLLDASPTPPLIVIQGDHGPRNLIDWSTPEKGCLLESAAILNAIYFPGEDYADLYPSITPVNTFRIILNEYFATGLSLEEDRTYYSNYARPFDFLDVTSQAQAYCSQQE